MEALIIKNLKKTYEGNHEALKGIDLNVEEGFRMIVSSGIVGSHKNSIVK